MRHQGTEIDRHPDADKKQPQQQALKRLNVALQGVAVLRARQQHAGEEGPHRHRQPDLFQQQPEAKHQEQRHGAEDFTQAGARDKTQHRPGQIASERHHQRQRARHFQGRERKRAQRRRAAARRQQRDHRHQRNGRDILEQQHRKGAAAQLGNRQVTFVHRLHSDRR